MDSAAGTDWADPVVHLLQCDQIGQFLKALDNKLSYKSSPNIY